MNLHGLGHTFLLCLLGIFIRREVFCCPGRRHGKLLTISDFVFSMICSSNYLQSGPNVNQRLALERVVIDTPHCPMQPLKWCHGLHIRRATIESTTHQSTAASCRVGCETRTSTFQRRHSYRWYHENARGGPRGFAIFTCNSTGFGLFIHFTSASCAI